MTKAIETFTRAAKEDQSIADDCRARIVLFRDIHSIVSAYRALLRAEKLGLIEKTYTPGEVQRIYLEYREMIHDVKTPGLTWEDFTKKVPAVPFQQSD
ncbi:MAG: hypothetical protein HZB31_04240 [Nitrospirae bacterium]|nr:hypothetical protein [Nitrospirota bacterium]